MLERIKNVIYPVLTNKNITIDETTVILKDLDINSYDIVELICALEDEFDISVPDKKIKSLVTVGDIIKFIEEQENNWILNF